MRPQWVRVTCSLFALVLFLTVTGLNAADLSVGFVDATCPPSSCYAAFNALRGPKEMLNEPLMSHAASPHIQEAFLARVLDHVKRHSEKP